MVSKKIAVIKVPTKEAIRQFLLITKPMHKLANQEINVITLILHIYYAEYTNFAREEDRWKHVFDYDVKVKLKEELKMTTPSFNNILTSLRKKGVLVNNQIPMKFRPNIKEGDKVLELVFRFELTDRNGH